MLGIRLERMPVTNSSSIDPRAIFCPISTPSRFEAWLITPVSCRPPISTNTLIKKTRVLQSTSRRIFCTVSMPLWWVSSRQRAAPSRAIAGGEIGTGRLSPTTNSPSTRATITPPRASMRGWLTTGWGRWSRSASFLCQMLGKRMGSMTTMVATAITPPRLSFSK